MTQKEALDIMKLGHNVYLTGSAGSGKTYLLNKYIEYLKSNNIQVGITASTGIAATHINGMTIHSWAGIGIKDELDKNDIKELKKKMYLRIRFSGTKVLIIDEVSMLHSHRLDMIDQVCRAFKIGSEPFGGLQVIMCGDFFQLPPVTKGKNNNSFAYESDSWEQMDLKVCYLEEQHRQSDSDFLRILSDIRSSNVTNATLDFLMTRYNKNVIGIGKPTKLYTHNVDVDKINNAELAKIKEKPEIFDMTASGNGKFVDILKKSCLAPEMLVIKKNAIVMFVKNNYEKGFVNGTLGKVVDFDEDNYPIIQTLDKKEIIASPMSWTIEDDGSIKAEVSQIPLRLAWAITVHKSQGMSLDIAEIDLGRSFVPGMGYVALSRVRSLAGMKLVGINDMALKVNQEISKMDNKLKIKSDHNKNILDVGNKRIKNFQKLFLEAVGKN